VTRAAAFALSAAALLGGCAAHRHGLATASVVRAGQHCGGEGAGPSARWIGDERGLVGALSAGGTLTEGTPRVDFSRDAVLAVSMGRRPTAGHSVYLHEPAVTIADGVATVVVRLETPAPGAMLAQVVTSPCLLLRIARDGIREVRVVDPAGAELARARAPSR